jgi:Protein of unknown function (DUF2281)
MRPLAHLKQEVAELPEELAQEVLDFLQQLRARQPWPTGLYARVAGGWQGAPLVREAQEPVAERLAME